VQAWAGTLLDRVRPIVIIAEPGREQQAALRLGRIGFDHLRGYLDGGMASLADRPDLVWPTERVSAATLAEELAGGEPPILLDIWNARERKAKHIPESLNIPLNHMQERIAELPRGRRIAVPCAGGYRSSIAASILHQYGITNQIWTRLTFSRPGKSDWSQIHDDRVWQKLLCASTGA
jgi:hydroxyacylglutathione hydrolase